MPGAALRAVAVSMAALVALTVAGCGGDGDGTAGGASTAPAGSDLHIYSSLRGAPQREKDSMDKAMRLAFDEMHGRAGRFAVKWIELDRSTSQDGRWTVEQVASDARAAARDQRTIGYIGEFESAASRIAIPILNNAQVSTVSPASTRVGLTTGDDPGGPKDDPQRNYPKGQRTFARVIPRDTVQAAALVATMKRDGCKKTALASDTTTYGDSLVRLIQQQAKDSGVTLLGAVGFATRTSVRALTTTFKEQGADCFLMAAGSRSQNPIRLYRAVANTLGAKARLYGTSELCHASFTSPGMPKAVARRFSCVLATLPVKEYGSGGEAFLKAYRRRWHDEPPTPYAIYAYEAMKLYLSTIAGMGPLGGDRMTVNAAIHLTSDRVSALGRYSFDTNGDTTMTDYGLYQVGPRGLPTFVRTVEAKPR